MTTLVIFRHGETEWNRLERFQGHLDIPLNDMGRAQASALAKVLRSLRLDAVVSSDLARARETAEIVSRLLGDLPVHIDPRLREANLGEAQGLTYSEIQARFGDAVVKRWRSSQATDSEVCYPGGETGAQVLSRALAALNDFARRADWGSRLGVATHGGVIRRVMSMIKGGESVPIPNGVFYVLEVDPGTGKMRAAPV